MEPQRSDLEKAKKQEELSKPLSERAEVRPTVRVEEETSPAQWVCMVLGVAFILVGMAGFVLPKLFTLNLDWGHNILFIASGMLTLWFGLGNSILTSERYSYIFGVIYAMLGAGGFLFGTDATMIPPNMEYDSFWWRLIPGRMELGTSDHFVHILIGLVLVIGAWLTARKLDKMAPKGTTWH